MPQNDPLNTASFQGIDAGQSPTVTNDNPMTPRNENRLDGESSNDASPQRYLLGEEIARGGMGEIYRSTDTVLRREVAVKVLQAKYDPKSGSAHRFADEARITGQLQHPAIPPVHDLGTLPDGRPFLAMKLIKGQTLDELLKDRPDPASDRGRFLATFEAVCQAMAYAHAHDVIHRDLKPANVMVGAFAEVQVMDWGLAKVLSKRGHDSSDPEETLGATEVVSLRDSDGSFTQAGSVLGTPAYMPPEQAVGAVGSIDARSDVFGLGAILAVILTGRPPFVANSAETTRVKAAQGDVAECFTKLDECGAEPELVALCKRCLAPKPDDRPNHAGEVATAVAELRAAAAERARQAELNTVKAGEERKRRKTQYVLAGVAASLLVATGFGATVTSLWKTAERSKESAEQSREDAETARRETEAAREKLARVEYGRSMQVAYQALLDNNVGTTLSLLENARKDLRGWEWNYIHRLCHEELFTITTPLKADNSYSDFDSAISPDKKHLAARGPDNTIIIWDLKTGKQLRALAGHTDIIDMCQYSRDGSRLMTDSKDNTVRIWDAKTGFEVRTIKWQYSTYRHSIFSPDGTSVLICSADKSAKLYNAITGNEIISFKNHSDELLRPLFSPDSSRILGGVSGREARVWDAKTGEVLSTLKNLPFNESEVSTSTPGYLRGAFNRDNTTIVIAGNQKEIVKAFDARSGVERYTISEPLLSIEETVNVHNDYVLACDGANFATASTFDNTVTLWDTSTGKGIKRFKGHFGNVYYAYLSPDRSTIATISFDDTVKIWNAIAESEICTLRRKSGQFMSLAFNFDGTRIATGNEDGTVTLWESKTGSEICVLRGHTDHIGPIWFSQDGSDIITLSIDGNCKVWDCHKESENIPFPDRHGFGCFSLDWSKYVVRHQSGSKVYDSRSGHLISSLQDSSGNDIFVAFDQRGKHIVMSGNDGVVRIWDSRTGIVSKSFNLSGGQRDYMAFSAISPDGTKVGYRSDNPNTAIISDTNTGKELKKLSHPDEVTRCEFSSDNKMIATACNDHVVRVWNVFTGVQNVTIKGHNSFITSMTFSADGTKLITCGSDNIFKLWNVINGELTTTFLGHARIVYSARLSPDEKRVVSTGGDGTVKFWDTMTGIELLSIPSKENSAFQASFSPDGLRVLTERRRSGVIWDSRPYREARREREKSK